MTEWWRNRLTRRCLLGGVGVAALTPALAVPLRPARAARAGDDPDAVKSAVQATLDLYGQLRTTADPALIGQLVDPRCPELARFIGDDVKSWAAMAAENRLAPARFQVDGLRPVQGDFVKADLTARFEAYRGTSATTQRGTFVFRPVGDQWLLSEPLLDELGDRLQRRTGHALLNYYAWDEPILDGITDIAERAYAVVAERSGLPEPATALPVNLQPTAETAKDQIPSGFTTIHTQGTIWMRSPESYGFLNNSTARVELTIQRDLQMGYGFGYVNARWGGKTQKSWMRVGFALWLGDRVGRDIVSTGFADGKINADLLDWAEGMVSRPQTNRRDTALAQYVAVHGIRYIAEAKGGLPQFLALGDRYADTKNWERTVQTVLNQSWTEFQRDYRSWLESWVKAN